MQNKNESIEEVFAQIEECLRLGDRLLAQKKIEQTLSNSVKITRILYPKWAELLRRGGYAKEAVKLLFRFVRGKGRNFKSAGVQEQEEYAASLFTLKATEEALLILNELQEKNSAKTFLFLGMAHINNWDYEKAIVHLRTYLEFRKLPIYDRYIGITNLMASLVAITSSGDEKLEKEIEEHLKETERLNFKVLHANLQEIKAQLLVKSIHRKSSQKSILKAASVINDPRSKENLFIRKWEILGQKPLGKEGGASQKKWINMMEYLREKALLINHVETVRDVDFYLGEFDSELIEKVFFGTPYPSFKEKILEAYKIELPESYWFDLPSQLRGKRFEFDYLKYKDLKKGSVVLKLLFALTHDFYRQQNKHTLFEAVFPNDHYNPHSSFNKIHQAIKRTRDWLSLHKIPMELKEDQEEYYLHGHVSIKIYLSDRMETSVEKKDERFYAEMRMLKEAYKDRLFSIHSAMEILKHKNLRKTQRLLKKALELELIEKINNSKNTAYNFPF